MKLEKGSYRVNRTTVFQSLSGYACQLVTGQQIIIIKRVRGGYYGRIPKGIFIHNVIVKNNQLETLRRKV